MIPTESACLISLVCAPSVERGGRGPLPGSRGPPGAESGLHRSSAPGADPCPPFLVTLSHIPSSRPPGVLLPPSPRFCTDSRSLGPMMGDLSKKMRVCCLMRACWRCVLPALFRGSQSLRQNKEQILSFPKPHLPDNHGNKFICRDVEILQIWPSKETKTENDQNQSPHPMGGIHISVSSLRGR